MATATIPAVFGNRTQASWKVAPARRANVSPGSIRTPGPDPLLKQEVRSVTRMSPEEPELSVDAQGWTNPPTPAPMQAPALQAAPGPMTPERAAVLAEQRALADLAARCLAGDAAAWEQLARTQHRKIYGICYRFTGSPTDAEDLTQEAFLKMYRNLASFDPAKGSFSTWLTTLTRNLLVDNYRRTRLERASDSLDETYDGEDDGPTKAERLTDGGKSQEQHVAGLELRAQIQAALKQVSPELREAVILRDLEDMDYKEIAEVLGIPQGTVKSRISRGRAELARLLKRIEGQVM
jgi:RNA polymerase sigma-70 factor (ECF subfamily)